MPTKIWPLAAMVVLLSTIFLMMLAPPKQDVAPAAAIDPSLSLPSAPRWQYSTDKDEMSDLVTTSATIDDALGSAKLILGCSKTGRSLNIVSDRLSSPPHYGHLSYRINDRPAEDADDTFYSRDTLSFYVPVDAGYIDVEHEMNKVRGDLLIARLNNDAAKQLRVRADMFDGTPVDFDFDVDGANEVIAKLAKACPSLPSAGSIPIGS